MVAQPGPLAWAQDRCWACGTGGAASKESPVGYLDGSSGGAGDVGRVACEDEVPGVLKVEIVERSRN